MYGILGCIPPYTASYYSSTAHRLYINSALDSKVDKRYTPLDGYGISGAPIPVVAVSYSLHRYSVGPKVWIQGTPHPNPLHLPHHLTEDISRTTNLTGKLIVFVRRLGSEH